MIKENVKELTTSQLVNICANKDMEMAQLKKDISVLQAEIQRRGEGICDEKNIKFTEFYGTDNNYAAVTFSFKLDILNYFKLKEVIGEELLLENIKRVPEYKYNIQAKFKQVLIAIFKDEYNREYTISDILDKASFELDDKQKKLLIKKLKGDYKKDKDTILSVIGKSKDEIDIDIELYYIYQIKNWELIKAYVDEQEFDEITEIVKKCITVEETPKITVKWKDEQENQEV